MFRFRFRLVANVVADRFLLAGIEIVKGFTETVVRLGVDPVDSFENCFAVFLLGRIRGADPLVDEVGDIQPAGARRFAVGR